MQLVTDERLSILKQFAREKFGLTRNVRILIMLISEEEHGILKQLYNQRLEFAKKTHTLVEAEGKRVHPSEEFFPAVAMVSSMPKVMTSKTRPLLLSTIKDLWKIPRVDEYEHFILMRQEKLEEYGKKRFSLTGDIASVNIGELGFSYLLAHEFLHIVEKELDTPIYTGDILKDDKMTFFFFKHLPGKYKRLKKKT